MLRGRAAFRSFAAVPLVARSDIIFSNIAAHGGTSLAACQARGDWLQTAQFIANGRDWIHGEVKKSEIRGRGGAGFPTATKWGFFPKDESKPHYLVINGDEGEPGTCKDREILTHEPHKLVEGALIAAYFLRAHSAYIYVRGEFKFEMASLQRAIDEARGAGLIGAENKFGYPFEFYIHSGAGAYVCGEETALINSIEGLPGRPRFKPPYPGVAGLWQCPTCVNNVETISSIPAILGRGGAWFGGLGVEKSRGTKLYGVSGCVNKPCVVEDQLGISLKELIEKHCGGVRGGWDNLLGVIPGGLSCPILSPKEAAEATMSYEHLASFGSALGTGAVIVLDKSVDIVRAFARVAAFYKHESCGQCGPCREGTAQMADLLAKIASGRGARGDVTALEETAAATTGCICALAGAASDPVKGLLKHFRQELWARLH